MFRGRRQPQGDKRPRRGPAWLNRKKTKVRREKKGPADCTIAELQEHYFDCSGYNEADRYVNTKKAIVQYLGQQFGGDVRVTLESGQMFVVPAPKDPAEDEVDDTDAAGNVAKTARQKVSYVKNKTFEKEIAEYVKKKQILSTNLEKAFSIILG